MPSSRRIGQTGRQGAPSAGHHAVQGSMLLITWVLSSDRSRYGIPSHGSGHAAGSWYFPSIVYMRLNPLARRLYQVLHQDVPQALLLPVIGHGHRAFAFVLLGFGVASHADFDQLAVVVHQGDEGHTVLIIDIHQLIHEALAGLVDFTQEARVPRLRGQVLDEIVFALSIGGGQRTYQHVAAVFEFVDPVFVGAASL